jgi:hypothetical protein
LGKIFSARLNKYSYKNKKRKAASKNKKTTRLNESFTDACCVSLQGDTDKAFHPVS